MRANRNSFPRAKIMSVSFIGLPPFLIEGGHTMVRGPCRILTDSWCFWPQRLPTTLNISTSMVIHSAIPSSLCNLAISESSQNLVKNYSIRVSTEIPPHPEPRTSGDHHREAYGDLEWVIGFHLSPNSACPRLSLAGQHHLNSQILVLQTQSQKAFFRKVSVKEFFIKILDKSWQNIN